jgi:hypothetical protein
MITFTTWLERREGVGSKVLALALPMGSALAGGAAGLAMGGPAGVLPGWLIGKKLGVKGSEKLFPQSTLELMKKK